MRCLLAIFLCNRSIADGPNPDSNSARVFITARQSWSTAGGGGGANGARINRRRRRAPDRPPKSSRPSDNAAHKS